MISVLIPTTGDRAHLLTEARNSAKAQGDVEVIVVKDATRKGQSHALNRAFQRSRGEYVTVLHDDDFYVRPDALACLRQTLDEHPEAAAAYSLPRYVDEQGQEVVTPSVLWEWACANPVVTSAKGGLTMHGIGILYRRQWWEYAGPWDESLPCCEEWDFHLRMLSLGAAFVCCPITTVAYRQHAAQKSARRGMVGRRSVKRLEVRKLIRARYGEY